MDENVHLESCFVYLERGNRVGSSCNKIRIIFSVVVIREENKSEVNSRLSSMEDHKIFKRDEEEVPK